MSTHANMVKATAAAPGTGSLTVSTAVSGFRTFAQGYNNANATVAGIRIEDASDPTIWEIDRDCGYTYSTNVLTRGTLENSSTGSVVDFTGAVVVSVILSAAKGNTSESAMLGHMSGVVGVWVSGTQLGCTSGSCFIESLGQIIFGAPGTITPSSPSASTWYHVYVYSNDGVLTLEASTTAPVAFATPMGTAKSKSGDSSRRYIYSALTTSGGVFRNFAVDDNDLYVFKGTQPNASPFRVLSNGTATTSTSISCSSVAPATAVSIIGSWIAIGGTGSSFLTSGDLTPSSTNFIFGVGGGQVQFGTIPCDTSQNLKYICTATAPSTYLDVTGFNFSR